MPRHPKHVPQSIPQSTFVLDNGGFSIKAGFAPTSLSLSDTQTLQNCQSIPNAIARTKEKRTLIAAQINTPTIQWNDAVFRRPVEQGQLVSWEAQKEIWDLSFFDEKTADKDMLIKQPEDTTLVLTEAPNTMPSLQKNADEIIMEEWGFGGYMRTVGSSLNAYNNLHPLFGDRDTSSGPDSVGTLPLECLLVIDSGFSHTIVMPTYKGRPLQRAIRRLDFGGKYLTNLLREIISVRHADLHQDVKVVNDIKEDVCFVSHDFKGDMERTWVRKKVPRSMGSAGQSEIPREADGETKAMEVDAEDPPREPPSLPHSISSSGVVDYILPDFVTRMRGQVVRTYESTTQRATERRKLKQRSVLGGTAAAADDDESLLTLGNERFTVPEIIFTPSDIGSTQPGLADMIMQSLATLPPLIQATMLANTLVVGGTAKLPGFVERLQSELRTLVRDDWVVRVRRMGDPVTSTWLGGARMATNREVVRKWGVTREEYMEHGSLWVGRRFAGLN